MNQRRTDGGNFTYRGYQQTEDCDDGKQGYVRIDIGFLDESTYERIHVRVGTTFLLVMTIVMYGCIRDVHAGWRLMSVETQVQVHIAHTHCQDCKNHSPDEDAR